MIYVILTVDARLRLNYAKSRGANVMSDPTPAELRQESRRLGEAARKEENIEVKRELASRALKCAERAEEIERDSSNKKASS